MKLNMKRLFAAVVAFVLMSSAAMAKSDLNLILAAMEGDIAKVEQQLQTGADVDAKDIIGETALMHAAKEGHTAVVEKLLLAGADVDAKNRFGETALILAAHKDDIATVRKLLQAGADEEIRDVHGYSASDWADNNDVKKLLYSVRPAKFRRKNFTRNLNKGLFGGKTTLILIILFSFPGAIIGFKVGRFLAKALRPDLFIGTTFDYISGVFFWTLGLPLFSGLIGWGLLAKLLSMIFRYPL